ncbi:hypothetical protein [Phorcysia thermohydrogeniphila]|uniref:Uncharacterized protein n=1 Tax=Phorcysia thermohydrogeniphila TaxID=936138 RepID=A0A4R1GCD0_9BACT|nr:hypothetical protein [Phorcysia thermohydrogeniphila]TCK03319.1 hypothetical protein CLV27_1390 [Phorcysia thermohydrogeniphila]
MELLVTGSLSGNVDRLKGLIDVSRPELVFVLGPIGVDKPLRLGVKWFFVRGLTDRLDVLAKSDGVDLLSRVFRYKSGLSFSGISGIYHPTTIRFTREEWIKARGKIDRKKNNYLFREDIEGLLVLFRNSGLERLDILLLSDSPEKPVFKEVLEVTRPRYVFFPSRGYVKEKEGDTTFIGLEEVSSTKGKYIIRL